MSILDDDATLLKKTEAYMKVKLVRTFHPAGHGAFYTERFYQGENDDLNIANVVYDCGTSYSKNTLLETIAKEFKQTDVIDSIFVSHFHDDHVNGIEDLCKRCAVKKIVVPLLPDEYKVWTMLYNAIEYGINSVANQILARNYLEERILGDVEVVFNENTYFMHKIPWTDNSYLWEYKALRLPNFSPSFSHRYKQLKSTLEVNNIFGQVFQNGTINLKLLYALLSQNPNIDVLKGILKKKNIRLDNNTFNMVVSSRRTNLRLSHFPSYLGCLYTGDAELKSIRRMKWLQSKLQLDNCHYHIIQVPHHGAKGNNHNISLYDQYQLCVISVHSNDNKHPNSDVIEDIITSNCIPKIITEDKRTCLRLTYYPV